MTREELKKIRIKQLLWINGALIISFIIYVSLLTTNISMDAIQFGLGLFLLLTGISAIVIKRELLYLLPSMKKLMDYEKEKLGEEWKRSRLTGGFMQIGLGLFFILLNMPPFSSEPFLSSRTFILFIIGLSILVTVVVNLSVIAGYRKLDRKTTEELKGFTFKNLIIGLLIGIAIVPIVMIGVLVIS
ncbi:hypothetical protein [Shouchella patagoniensis]|uniref:hypothetical protein n=1 Tax=Shouchella patagoniensis TaxID=228576 RepID=UPI000995D8AF|nr:hypothetical protein [Shouchella patagoniensis]